MLRRHLQDADTFNIKARQLRQALNNPDRFIPVLVQFARYSVSLPLKECLAHATAPA